jgi:starch-binding outer membrane protein, SusD/RagB family
LYPTTPQAKALFEAGDKRLDYFLPKNNLFFAGKSKKTKLAPADPVYCLRLAEMYLIQAETQARSENNVSPQALQALNTVRQRAGLKPKQLADFPTVSSFVEEIVIEKRRELMFETGDAWFDMVRADLAGKLLGVTDPNAYVYPIPNSEIVNNPKLKQNAGY